MFNRQREQMLPSEVAEENLPKTELAALVQHELKERNMNFESLRKIIQTSYETARRIGRGIFVPGAPVLKLMSDYFDWDYRTVIQMAIRDRERLKYGEEYDHALSLAPDIQKINRGWKLLSNEQRSKVLEQVAYYIEHNMKAH